MTYTRIQQNSQTNSSMENPTPNTRFDQLSFDKGAVAQYVLNSLVSEVDKQHARQRSLEGRNMPQHKDRGFS